MTISTADEARTLARQRRTVRGACRRCKTPFEGLVTRVYCSDACRLASYEDRHRAQRARAARARRRRARKARKAT